MVNTLTQLLIGFSVVSAMILLFAYLFFLRDMQKTRLGLLACTVLLGAIVWLQLEHLVFLRFGSDLFASATYVVALLAAPPSFYFFSREVLFPEPDRSLFQLAHLLPPLLGFFLPEKYVALFALALGVGYALWFARIVYGMRRHVKRFRFEMFFFGFFAITAACMLLLGVLVPYLGAALFYVTYAIFAGIALVLIVALLIIYPEVLTEISDAAKLSYATTTLAEVDTDAKQRELQRLMSEERLFENEDLNLSLLAQAVELSPHQLSELINTRFAQSFSRYVREQRVARARQLLRAEPSASVLSISMMVGFRSQSNFYAAFREITGEAPGAFRKKLLSNPDSC